MLGKADKRKKVRIQTLVGHGTEVRGDIHFQGGIHIDGHVKGNVIAVEGSASLLTLSEHGVVEGEVRVPKVRLNGTVTGDVHASEHVELAPNARVTGNVFYSLIEMAMGAEVNGKLVHQTEADVHQVVPLEVKEHGKRQTGE